MITVIFKCDICEHEDVYSDLHNGYVMPQFNEKDICQSCRWEAILDLRKKNAANAF